MLLIYVTRLTNRLGYTLNVLFGSLLKIDFQIPTDEQLFERHSGPRLCYGDRPIGDAPFIKAHRLLFETSIEEQNPRHFIYQGIHALFPVYGQGLEIPFDPFAATFYMASRYEEYLPHRSDNHGRFLAQDSLAFKEGFVESPVVDQWALMVRDLISSHYPEANFPSKNFSFTETIDIDAAYSYKYKGIFRTIAGLLRDGLHNRQKEEVAKRIRVLMGKEDDPYDTFEHILDTRKQHKNMKLLFFVLLGDYSLYDKPTSYHTAEFRELLQRLGDYSKIGIHPSYASQEEPQRIEKETKRLADILHRPIVRSRFHFLRFSLPSSYRALISYDIQHDYSMGYAECPGYRCGTATPYPFYDLSRDVETSLTIHPFVVMDTTLQQYCKMSPQEALECYKKLIDEARNVGGTFCCIWHNQNLSETQGWEGWRQVHDLMIDYGTPKGA